MEFTKSATKFLTSLEATEKMETSREIENVNNEKVISETKKYNNVETEQV